MMMAGFTMGWAWMAENILNGSDYYMVVIIFSFLSYGFIGYAIYSFIISKKVSSNTINVKELETKKRIKSFYINFGIEVIVIGIVYGILSYLRLNNFITPSIALIIGLHFYPLAKIFKRNIDYYFASWTCIVAICGIVMLIFKSLKVSDICTLVSIGVALATTGYGIYMLYTGRKYAKEWTLQL